MALHEAVGSAYDSLPNWLQTGLAAILVLVVGWIAVGVVRRAANPALHRIDERDATVASFLGSVITGVAWAGVIIVLLMVLGFDTATLGGLLAAGGFIVGFATKDVLGNLAAGVMLLLYRPMSVGEVVTIGGTIGTVHKLKLGITVLRPADGRLVSMPNGQVLGSDIINHTREPIRRAEVAVGISYDDDIGLAIKAIMEALAADERFLKDPEPQVRLTGLGDSSVNLSARAWVNTQDFWEFNADMTRVVKAAVENAGCTIPFPQRDVHMSHDRPA